MKTIYIITISPNLKKNLLPGLGEEDGQGEVLSSGSDKVATVPCTTDQRANSAGGSIELSM